MTIRQSKTPAVAAHNTRVHTQRVDAEVAHLQRTCIKEDEYTRIQKGVLSVLGTVVVVAASRLALDHAIEGAEEQLRYLYSRR